MKNSNIKHLKLGYFYLVLYNFFYKEKPGQRIWFDFNFGKDWFTFIWWKKGKPVLYTSPDATPPTKGFGKYIFGSALDMYPK